VSKLTSTKVPQHANNPNHKNKTQNTKSAAIQYHHNPKSNQNTIIADQHNKTTPNIPKLNETQVQ